LVNEQAVNHGDLKLSEIAALAKKVEVQKKRKEVCVKRSRETTVEE
jgi:hypothetical protein